MKKRFIACLMAFVLFTMCVCPINAVDAGAVEANESKIIYFDDGSYIEISGVRQIDNTSRAAQTKIGEKDITYTASNGDVEWQYTLTGYFSYDPGVSSTCTYATYSNNISNTNWSFSDGAATRSGNTAYGDGLYIKKVLFVKVKEYIVDISISCDSYGNLS